MLPYPSGDIHVGHVRNYCITDVVARYKTMRGFNVLHPIGWDALGPARRERRHQARRPSREVDAREHRGDEAAAPAAGLQLSRGAARSPPAIPSTTAGTSGSSCACSRRASPTAPRRAVNWCPSCQTVLANEQAEGGECWRCHSKVEQRELDQWFLRITAYQDELLDDMAQLPHVARARARAAAQLGRPLARRGGGLPGRGRRRRIRVFTTRVDTIYGATFMVLAPEHPLVDELLAGRPDAAKARAADRPPARAGPPRAAGRAGREGRRLHRPLRGEPVQRRAHPDLGRQLRADGLRHRRDHGGARARLARLRVRAQVRPARARRDPARGRHARRRHAGRGLRWAGPHREQRPFDGLESDEAIRRMAAHARGEGLRQGHGHVPPEGLADQPPALLGHADPGRLLREGRHGAGARRPAPGGAAAGRAVHRRGRQPAREGAGVRERAVPALRRRRRGARPTPWTPSWTRPGTSTATCRRTRTDGPFDPAPCATGSRSTCTSAASSTRSCTSSTRASGPR